MRQASLFVIVACSGCAQLLSWDDYRAREASPDAELDTSYEAAVDANEAAVDTGPPPARIPARPSGSATPSGSGKTVWLAVRRFKLGSIDIAGGSDADAWRALGFDLDGRCTSAADSAANVDSCRKPASAAPDSLLDGDACRDNNFGRHVGALVRGVSPMTERDLNARVEAGQRTWVLEIQDADAGDDPYAPGRLWGVRDERPSGAVMKWDGTDVRMAANEAVEGGDVEKPLITFPKGFIVGDTWVSGEDEEHTYVLPLTNNYLIPLRMRHSTFTLLLDPDRANGHQGVIGGVFDRDAIEVMTRELVRYAGQCPGSTLYTTALASTTTAFDVSVDAPSLQDTAKECDGLSGGMGVDVRAVQPLAGTVAPPRTPPVDTCPDAGTD